MMLRDDHASLSVDTTISINLSDPAPFVLLNLRKENYMWPEMEHLERVRHFRLDPEHPAKGASGYLVQENQLRGTRGHKWGYVRAGLLSDPGERIRTPENHPELLRSTSLYHLLETISTQYHQRCQEVSQQAEQDPDWFRAIVSSRVYQEHAIRLSGASPHHTSDVHLDTDGVLVWTGKETLPNHSHVFDAAVGEVLVARHEGERIRLVLQKSDHSGWERLRDGLADIHHHCVHSVLNGDLIRDIPLFDRTRFMQHYKPRRVDKTQGFSMER